VNGLSSTHRVALLSKENSHFAERRTLQGVFGVRKTPTAKFCRSELLTKCRNELGNPTFSLWPLDCLLLRQMFNEKNTSGKMKRAIFASFGTRVSLCDCIVRASGFRFNPKMMTRGALPEPAR
jgi:hypothetical protein